MSKSRRVSTAAEKVTTRRQGLPLILMCLSESFFRSVGHFLMHLVLSCPPSIPKFMHFPPRSACNAVVKPVLHIIACAAKHFPVYAHQIRSIRCLPWYRCICFGERHVSSQRAWQEAFLWQRAPSFCVKVSAQVHECIAYATLIGFGSPLPNGMREVVGREPATTTARGHQKHRCGVRPGSDGPYLPVQ